MAASSTLSPFRAPCGSRRLGSLGQPHGHRRYRCPRTAALQGSRAAQWPGQDRRPEVVRADRTGCLGWS
ncbi:MAG: hypothetical protein MZV64_10435 [Ignavibacteriales bacterium]|nr:hypothetical protein [Ignavibacteriales bacterium]